MSETAPSRHDVLPLRILAVTDLARRFELLERSLTLHGRPIQGRRAAGLDQLRQALASEPVDLVVLDLANQLVSPAQVIAVVHSRDRDMPAIAICPEGGERQAGEALQSGFDEVVTDVAIGRLDQAIARTLRATKVRRENRANADALADSEKRLRALTRHLETIKEEERYRIAREIHDDIGATLTALRFELVGLVRQSGTQPILPDRLGPLIELVEQAVEASHRIQHNLRPPVLDAGLVDALQWLVRNFRERTGLSARFETNQEDIPLSAESAAAMYRVTQESLTNIAKYAQAQLVSVHLFASGDEVTLEISDNGVGFDIGLLRATPGFGLRGIIERARGLDGWAEVSSAPGRGTTIMFCVPMRPDTRVKADQ
jgi:signal transduction histidine kinase